MDIKNLSNSKMGKLVARLLGKPQLDVVDGKVSLTEQEKATILKEYGEQFLEKLENVDVTDETATELFDAAVNAKVDEATSVIRTQMSNMQEHLNLLEKEPEKKPSAQNKAGQEIPEILSLNMNAAHNRLVAEALASSNPMAFAALENATIDIKDLNQEFSIAMPPKTKLDLITKRLYLGFNDSQHMTRIQSNTDYIASAAIMSEVSQQFTPKWTPKGTTKFTPIRIPYRRHKINVLIQPADVIKSWLLALYEQGKTMAEMPITRYIIEEHILPRTLEDITLSMVGKGKFKAAGTVKDGDTGSDAKDSMDGYETILVEGKKDAKCKMNFFKAAKDYTTLSDTDLLKYVDDFVDAISGLFVKKLVVHCSEQFLTRYKRADFAVNGKYTGIENGGEIRFTKFNLVPLESMYNSKILFATPKENFVELVDYSKADSCINKIEEANYDVKIFGEYSLSVGFKIAEAVFAAVPEGYDPQASILSASKSTEWEHGAGTDAEGA